ncbi:hypothetical protein UFOVP49_45 [uncultured Caudovirales phage]|uniref:Uncharacterized protein n=1 Tax=uncultured Caudovirales phage TaxID=2100421 RepID=A0A6J5KTG2_9CAUD|nr:hypothetical protein UFOVP49_45 [uncultured Caudovirales phage]
MSVKRFSMPCFATHGHPLQEDLIGYIIQASDYDALVAQNKKLEEEIVTLKKQLATANKAIPKKAKNGPKFVIRVPIDEDDPDWMIVTDLVTGEPQIFYSQEEADKAGIIFGQYKVEKFK